MTCIESKINIRCIRLYIGFWKVPRNGRMCLKIKLQITDKYLECNRLQSWIQKKLIDTNKLRHEHDVWNANNVIFGWIGRLRWEYHPNWRISESKLGADQILSRNQMKFLRNGIEYGPIQNKRQLSRIWAKHLYNRCFKSLFYVMAFDTSYLHENGRYLITLQKRTRLVWMTLKEADVSIISYKIKNRAFETFIVDIRLVRLEILFKKMPHHVFWNASQYAGVTQIIHCCDKN